MDGQFLWKTLPKFVGCINSHKVFVLLYLIILIVCLFGCSNYCVVFVFVCVCICVKGAHIGFFSLFAFPSQSFGKLIMNSLTTIAVQ